MKSASECLQQRTLDAGGPSPEARTSSGPTGPVLETPRARSAKPPIPWPVVAVVMMMAGAWLGWTLFVRLPLAWAPVRRLPAGADVSPGADHRFSVTDLERLRGEVSAASSNLMEGRAELLRLTARMESEATARGWKTDLRVHPPGPSLVGLEELTAYPVTFELEHDRASAVAPGTGLLAWLDALRILPRRVDVVDLQLQGDAAGLKRARVGLRFLGRTTYEQAPSE